MSFRNQTRVLNLHPVLFGAKISEHLPTKQVFVGFGPCVPGALCFDQILSYPVSITLNLFLEWFSHYTKPVRTGRTLF